MIVRGNKERERDGLIGETKPMARCFNLDLISVALDLQ